MNVITGANLRSFTTPGSMGVVTDTRYVRCIWPALDAPVSLFAEGSSGIEVQGPPTPRNVVFPVGTSFLPILVAQGPITQLTYRESAVPTNGACFFVRERKVQDVTENVETKAQLEVEPGLTREVTYTKPTTVQKEVESDTILTVQAARDLADGKITVASAKTQSAGAK